MASNDIKTLVRKQLLRKLERLLIEGMVPHADLAKALRFRKKLQELIDDDQGYERTQGGSVPTVKEKEFDLDEEMKKFPTVGIEKRGTQIILPEGMDLLVAIEWLKRRMREEEQMVGILEYIEGYPLDGANAFALALEQRYGWAAMASKPGGFFSGPTPPQMLSVDVDVNRTVSVPWGDFNVPGIDGTLQSNIGKKNDRPCFILTGAVKHKHRAAVAELARLTRQLLTEKSIYRGKAIRVSFPDPNQRDYDVTQDMPKFMETSGVTLDSLVFSRDVMEQIQTSIINPIIKTQRCRDMKIPLKRGVLLHGPWGVGKTLTANAVANTAVAHGWTFIYLRDLTELAQAIPFARSYQPAVIFGEDFDRIASARTNALNDLLNIIDGIDAKTSEVMVVMTTNSVEDIEGVMLRYGRIDAVIDVKPPDAEAAARLVRLYAGSLLVPGANLDEVGRALEGKIPAMIREVVERSKLAAIGRIPDDQPVQLEPGDLLVAARGMEQHLALLAEEEPDERSNQEKAAEIFGESVGNALGASVLATRTIVHDELQSLTDREVVDLDRTAVK